MKVFKKILIFCATWTLTSFLILLFATLVCQKDAEGKVIAGSWYTYMISILPVACGIFACRFWPTKYQFAKKVTPAMLHEAERLIPSLDYFSISLLQRKLGIASFSVASELTDQLEEKGLINRLSDFKWEIVGKGTAHKPGSMLSIDTMEGHEFEYWCADILRKNDFIDVTVTQGSGDQGVDVLAVKDGIKYAIQCKCYSSDLGNKPVQEVYTGKSVYRCQIGAVMTNRHFTQGAKDAAEATGVLLWDRDAVERMANKAGML